MIESNNEINAAGKALFDACNEFSNAVGKPDLHIYYASDASGIYASIRASDNGQAIEFMTLNGGKTWRTSYEELDEKND